MTSGWSEIQRADDRPGAELGGARDVRSDLSGSERHEIARRIAGIIAQCRKEMREGLVVASMVELRLALLADDVRAGLHGGGA